MAQNEKKTSGAPAEDQTQGSQDQASQEQVSTVAEAAAVMSEDVKAAEAPKLDELIGKRHSLQAVHGGPMVNPLTEDRFEGQPSKLVTIDSWLLAQIEAGKLKVVE